MSCGSYSLSLAILLGLYCLSCSQRVWFLWTMNHELGPLLSFPFQGRKIRTQPSTLTAPFLVRLPQCLSVCDKHTYLFFPEQCLGLEADLGKFFQPLDLFASMFSAFKHNHCNPGKKWLEAMESICSTSHTNVPPPLDFLSSPLSPLPTLLRKTISKKICSLSPEDMPTGCILAYISAYWLGKKKVPRILFCFH